MKHSVLTGIVVLMVSSMAYAGQQHDGSNPAPSATASASAKADVHNYVSQGQKQGQAQGQQQSNSAIGTGNQTSTNTATNVRAEPAIAPDLSGLVGTNCMGSTTASGAGGGIVALGFGTSWTDHDCERRENAKYLNQMGFSDIAFALLCKNEGVADAAAAVGKKCPVAPKQASGAPRQLTASASTAQSPYSEQRSATRPLFGN